ncbi:MAG: exosome complex RNA-binding protein Csl4 [Methanophagales archaeon]|nr:exosome complex RNA-binding protein Csl4 [Methanophagales archaeon]MCW3140835.1 exosome complex RNA-binding protein Csl4 [Methanophagales archaeon]
MGRNKGIVVPGDFLGTTEEFTSGMGVYDEEGNLYASQIGEISISDKRVINVLPVVETPPILEEGDVVLGRIEDIKDTVAIVSIACVKGKEKREIAAPTQGIIHISNIKKGYVSELKQEFGYLDVIKAKVLDVKTLRLSTEERDLGVIKAICMKCKGDLERKGNVLRCERCKRVETRKISEDYGKGMI